MPSLFAQIARRFKRPPPGPPPGPLPGPPPTPPPRRQPWARPERRHPGTGLAPNQAAIRVVYRGLYWDVTIQGEGNALKIATEWTSQPNPKIGDRVEIWGRKGRWGNWVGARDEKGTPYWNAFV